MRLELRLAQMDKANKDKAQAMKSRTTINLAVGAIMAQNRSSQDAALRILHRASSNRNIKLRDIAAGVIGAIIDNTHVRTHFDQ